VGSSDSPLTAVGWVGGPPRSSGGRVAQDTVGCCDWNSRCNCCRSSAVEAAASPFREIADGGQGDGFGRAVRRQVTSASRQVEKKWRRGPAPLLVEKRDAPGT